MRKEWTLLILGIWITILPYLGFPYSWKGLLFTLSGLGLIYFSYTMYQENKMKRNQKSDEKTFDNFSENRDFNE